MAQKVFLRGTRFDLRLRRRVDKKVGGFGKSGDVPDTDACMSLQGGKGSQVSVFVNFQSDWWLMPVPLIDASQGCSEKSISQGRANYNLSSCFDTTAL